MDDDSDGLEGNRIKFSTEQKIQHNSKMGKGPEYISSNKTHN